MIQSRRQKRVTDEALESRDRVAKAANAIIRVLDHREERADTHPFLKIEELDEPSELAVSIENAIASRGQ